MRQKIDTYGAGGFLPAAPGQNVIASTTRILAGLGGDRDTIPANGTTFATLNYAGPEPSPHAWTVNGATSNIPAVLDAGSGLMVSEIEVTATQAGPVEITAVASALTLQAV